MQAPQWYTKTSTSHRTLTMDQWWLEVGGQQLRRRLSRCKHPMISLQLESCDADIIVVALTVAGNELPQHHHNSTLTIYKGDQPMMLTIKERPRCRTYNRESVSRVISVVISDWLMRDSICFWQGVRWVTKTSETRNEDHHEHFIYCCHRHGLLNSATRVTVTFFLLLFTTG
jgi:hypothetical protein